MTTKKLFSAGLATIVGAALFTSCTKDSKPAIQPPYATLNDALRSVAPQPVTVSFDAATGSTFRGNSGTRYVFQPNSFRDASGNSVTGMVQIVTTEYLTKSDMIFSSMMPFSNGEPLISGGEINITATQNGKNIFMKPHVTWHAQMPQGTTADPGLGAFIGGPAENAGANAVNWNPADTARALLIFVTASGDTVSLFDEGFELFNADHFLTNPNYQSFSVSLAGLPAGVTFERYAYACYDTKKAVWNMYQSTSSNPNTITESHVPNIPVHFVVCAYGGGKFYGGITAATPATGSTYNVTMTEETPLEFKAQVQALP